MTKEETRQKEEKGWRSILRRLLLKLKFYRRESILDRGWGHSVAGGNEWMVAPYNREHAQLFVDELEAHTEQAVRVKWIEHSHQHKQWSAPFRHVIVLYPHINTMQKSKTSPAVPFVSAWLEEKEQKSLSNQRIFKWGAFAAMFAAVIGFLQWCGIGPTGKLP